MFCEKVIFLNLAPLHDILEPTIATLMIELYDIEYLTEHGRQILRIYIDKEGGISIDDCEKVNNAVIPVLDKHDPIPGSYILEVSSPGITRKLIKDSHFAANTGKMVEIKLKKPFDGQKKFTGVLLGAEKEAILIDVGEETKIPREHMAYCRLILIP